MSSRFWVTKTKTLDDDILLAFLLCSSIKKIGRYRKSRTTAYVRVEKEIDKNHCFFNTLCKRKTNI